MPIKLADISPEYVKNSRLRFGRMTPTNPVARAAIKAEEKDLQFLADSIKRDGLLAPLVVYPTGHGGVDAPGGAPKFALFSGNRRRTAMLRLGLTEIPDNWIRITDPPKDDADSIAKNAVENLQREDLHPVEVCDVIARLRATGLGNTQVAKALGKDPSTVSNQFRVASAPFFGLWRDSYAAGGAVPTFTACLEILAAAGPDPQKAIEYFGMALRAAEEKAEGKVPDFVPPASEESEETETEENGEPEENSGLSAKVPVRSAKQIAAAIVGARTAKYDAKSAEGYERGFWNALQWITNNITRDSNGKVIKNGDLPYAWEAPVKGAKKLSDDVRAEREAARAAAKAARAEAREKAKSEKAATNA